MNTQKTIELCKKAWLELEARTIELSEEAEKGNEKAQEALEGSIHVIWSDGERAGWQEEGLEGFWANLSYVVKFKFNETSYEDIESVVISQEQ